MNRNTHKKKNNIRQTQTIFSGYLFLLFALLPHCLLGDGGMETSEVIPWIRLPSPCQEAVKAYKKDIDLLIIHKKREYGTFVYEIQFNGDGVYTKLEMTADGRFLEIQEEIPIHKLPPLIQKQVEVRPNDKTEIRAKAVILYTYKIEYEDGRIPLQLDATGKPFKVDNYATAEKP